MKMVYEIVTRVTAPATIGAALVLQEFEDALRLEMPKHFACEIEIGRVRIAASYTTEQS